ncbi:hypothetical protein DAPPUDRAFT_270228 [Daphnia pulex]|nr:hypothetical protein DAPPUDRAFT_270228 [Daphnia pulex]|eukprot:EFX62545.1 hypothetical protein DAPPUDRAFT_270228 [Daphnia pulex]
MLRGVHQPENEQKKNEWVELAEKIFRMYFASGHLHSARRALSNALVTCADHFKMEHFNLLLELQILTKHYLDVIKTLNRHCGLVFNNKIIDEIDLEETESMELTKDLPLDILSKLCITLCTKRAAAKKVVWESADEDSDDEELEFGASSIELQEEYRLLRLTCEYLFKEQRLVELERICFTALTSPLFRRKREICREIQFITLEVCLAKGDSYYAYNLARGLLLRHNLYKKRVWNLMIQTCRQSGS